MATDLDAIKARIQSPAPIRWLFAGDSITHGIVHTLGWRHYVELFSERVRWELLRTRDCVINTACSGWKIADIRDDIEWSILQYPAHIVSINIGMNDCAAGGKDRGEFESMYLDVVKTIREKTGALILLHTPNRILPADTLRAPHLADYACSVRDVAAKTNAALVDHFNDWEDPEKNGWMAYLLSDALHPNEYGHRLMNRTLLQSLEIWDEKSITGRLLIPSPAQA